MKKEFRIVALHALPNEGILVTLVPVFSVRVDQPQDRTPRLESVIVGPKLQSEEARMTQEMMKGVFDELERRGMPSQSQSVPPLSLAVTKEEYEGLGKPLVNQLVTLSIEKADEGSE